jgi:hypothetical protein
MTAPTDKRKTPVWPVILAVILLVGFFAVFLLEFLNISGADTASQAGVASNLSADTYSAEVTALLANADADRGERHVVKHGCTACHFGAAVQNNLAPAFEGVALRAETRRPPLTAATYLYESILYPTAYESGDYSAQMPLTYGTLPEREIGDIIAFLLTQTQETDG